LALSRRFVELMGLVIDVKITPGQGSLFWFEIEAGEARAPAMSALEQAAVMRLSQEALPLRLLVVDDHAENRDVLRQLLAGWGFEVAIAADGREGVAQWRRLLPALTWMDLRMPVMDGFAACQAIHEVARELGHPPPKVIAITASHLGLHDPINPEHGFASLVGKPFREAEIRHLIEAQLHVRFEEAQPPPPLLEAHAWDDAMLSSALSKLDEAVITPYRTAVMLADFDGTGQAIAEIAKQAPALAKQLHRLLEEYRFDRMQMLIEQG
jgi:CheY-like chemotaxis protein